MNSFDPDEVLQEAMARFPEEIALSVELNDETLFTETLNKTVRVMIDDALVNLINIGLVEPFGVTEDGDMLYGLSEKGKEYVEDRKETGR